MSGVLWSLDQLSCPTETEQSAELCCLCPSKVEASGARESPAGSLSDASRPGGGGGSSMSEQNHSRIGQCPVIRIVPRSFCFMSDVKMRIFFLQQHQTRPERSESATPRPWMIKLDLCISVGFKHNDTFHAPDTMKKRVGRVSVNMRMSRKTALVINCFITFADTWSSVLKQINFVSSDADVEYDDDFNR